jgi:phage terminase small subunit
MAKKPAPPLKLVTATDATWPEPPRTLDDHGRSLWDRIQREYAIADAGGLELLLLACEGIDRIWALRQEIARDGAVIRMRNGAVKEHPALKAEIAAMSFVTRTLARLGLEFEPVRPSVGRPSGSGWRG